MKKVPALLRSLEEKRASGFTLSEIAEGAQIAMKTLAEIRSNTDQHKRSMKDNRGRVGLAESLTRLAVYLKIEPRLALSEYGFSDDDVGIRAALQRGLRSVSRPQMVPDRALSDIELRGHVINVGILDWPPFYDPAAKSSFAVKLMRRLVRSINPDWKLEILPISTIPEAIDSLISDTPACDVVFGLYETSYRRQLGLDFVSVPGLHIELGAVSATQISWPELIDVTREPGPVAVVMKEEAGFHFLRGPCDYDDRDLRALDSHDPHVLAAALLHESQSNRKRPVALVADAFTCRSVLSSLQTSGWTKHWRWETPEPSLEDSRAFSLVERQHPWTPQYSVGVAVRADSMRFRDLLVGAMRQDLFGSGILGAARFYNELHSVVVEGQNLSFSPGSFEFLGKDIASTFAAAWAHILKTTGASLDEMPEAFRKLLPNEESGSQTEGGI